MFVISMDIIFIARPKSDYSTIEKRIRVRLGLPTSYNNTKQEIQGDMNINKPGEENINNLSDDDLDLILSANDDENEEFLDKI